MPNRIIEESICTSESIDQLSYFQEAFFYRLWTHCDDYGRMDARPAILKAKLFPLKTELSLVEIENALDALVRNGSIILYEIKGKPYLFIINWTEHQRVRNSREKYPPPEKPLYSDNLPQLAANCRPIQSNPIRIQSESESNPNPYIPPSGDDGECEAAPAEKPIEGGAQDDPGKGKYSEGFDDFWDAYPRRIEKAAALKAWQRRRKEKVHAEDMIIAARNYADYCLKRNTEVQYIKHPSTFLGRDKPYTEYINGPPESPTGVRRNVATALKLVEQAQESEQRKRQIW